MSDYRSYRLNKKENIKLIFVLIMVTEVLGILIYDVKLGFTITPFIYVFAKRKYEEILMIRRRDDLRNQFKDSLYSMSSSFAAGRHMIDAVKTAIPHLRNIYGDGSDMEKELLHMASSMEQAAGEETELWADLGMRSGIEDISDFGEVFSACRDAGGDLVFAADNAARILTEKIGIENEIRLTASQKVTEGRLVGTMPFIMILFLRLTSPAYISVMYETLTGKMIMTVSMIITCAAFIVTERITKIEV